ncbi:hypothetical protein N0V90_012589 [Kalmusia sp. IMI 367209]|nr:hypothetical protein N0V90_012589 [Kalmusia sp. IMI 367209]
MQALRRTATSAARKGRTTLPRQQRRYAHDEHAHHAHAEPVSESMGVGFWVPIGLIPALSGLYLISRSDDPNAPPLFTRLIDRYTDASQKWAERNDLHVRMIEQAGTDRVLFVKSKGSQHVDMRFPEIMNVGSPYNVPAGSMANMDKVIEKFKKQGDEDNERKLQALRDGTIKSEQPFERFQIQLSEDNKR